MRSLEAQLASDEGDGSQVASSPAGQPSQPLPLTSPALVSRQQAASKPPLPPPDRRAPELRSEAVSKHLSQYFGKQTFSEHFNTFLSAQPFKKTLVITVVIFAVMRHAAETQFLCTLDSTFRNACVYIPPKPSKGLTRVPAADCSGDGKILQRCLLLTTLPSLPSPAPPKKKNNVGFFKGSP